MKNLEGKIAFITGAGSGIGRATALLLAEKGCTVLVSDVNEKGLSETQALLEKNNRKFESHMLDVANADAIKSIAVIVLQKHGHIDILINNAGISISPVSYMDVPTEDFEKLIDINFFGVIRMTHAFLPSLLKRPEASVVNISSVFGLFGVPNQVAYCTSKYGVRGFTESLRTELKSSSVALTSVHPGGIKTNIARGGIFYKDGDREQVANEFEKLAISSPEYAAKKIVKGILQKKKRVFIGPDAHLMYFLSRFWPGLLEFGAIRSMKKYS